MKHIEIILSLFLFLITQNKAMAEEKIYLLPLGNLKKEIIQNLKDRLQDVLDRPLDVEIAAEQKIPFAAYNPSRGQYHSSLILDELSQGIKINNLHERALGIIDVDLYVEGLNFVFGEADPDKGFCIISLSRLRQEFYRLPKNDELFYQRALKEAVHELGHTWGLSHCANPKCVMYFSNSLLDTDRKDFWFCPICQKKLKQK